MLTHRRSDDAQLPHALGAAMLVFGLVTAFGGMTVLLAHDEYLAVRADGILVHRSRGDVVLAWAEVLAVRYDPAEQALIFDAATEPHALLAERYLRARPGESSQRTSKSYAERRRSGRSTMRRSAGSRLGPPHEAAALAAP